MNPEILQGWCCGPRAWTGTHSRRMTSDSSRKKLCQDIITASLAKRLCWYDKGTASRPQMWTPDASQILRTSRYLSSLPRWGEVGCVTGASLQEDWALYAQLQGSYSQSNILPWYAWDEKDIATVEPSRLDMTNARQNVSRGSCLCVFTYGHQSADQLVG